MTVSLIRGGILRMGYSEVMRVCRGVMEVLGLTEIDLASAPDWLFLQ